MSIGIALLRWDIKVGAIVDIKYPKNFEINDDLVNKVYLTHAHKKDFKTDELIEISYDDQIILSYCDKTTSEAFGYELLVLIVHIKEKPILYNIKLQLLDFAKKVFQVPKDQQKEYILENVEIFFKKSSKRKVLLLGRAGTGKTSIKKIVFEGKNPKDLIYNPLEPTRGITPSVYSWLDLDLGVFDSAGQELNVLFEDEKEQAVAFENSDCIVYIFDFPTWNTKSQEIIKEIKRILEIIKRKSYRSKVILFLHKIDLINQESRENDLESIGKIIKKEFNLPIYYTSIYPDLIYSTYNAFCEILSSFSEESFNLKKILDKNIKNCSKLMCFIIDKNNSIIVQTMTKDFNTLIINHFHKLIVQLNQTFEDISKSEIDHLILSSSKGANIIMDNLRLFKFNIKYLIGISESLGTNKLILLASQIRLDLNNYLYLNKLYRI